MVTLVDDDGSMPSVLRDFAGESIFTPHAVKPFVLLTITWKFGELRRVMPYSVKSSEESAMLCAGSSAWRLGPWLVGQGPTTHILVEQMLSALAVNAAFPHDAAMRGILGMNQRFASMSFLVDYAAGAGMTSYSRGLRVPYKVAPPVTNSVTDGLNSSGPERKALCALSERSSTARRPRSGQWLPECGRYPVVVPRFQAAVHVQPPVLREEMHRPGEILGSVTLRTSCAKDCRRNPNPQRHQYEYPDCR